MKITRKILQNIIKEELESILSEMSLNEQERSFISKAMDPAGLVQKGREFYDKVKSTQGKRYKSRKQVAAALALAAAPKTPLGQTVVDLNKKLDDMAEVRDQQLDSLAGRIQAIEKKLGLIEKKLGL